LCPPGEATTTRAPSSRSRWIASALEATASWTSNSVPTEPWTVSGWVGARVADDEGVDARGGARAHDRAQVPGSLDALGDREQAGRSRVELGERRRRALRHGEQPVRARAPGDRAEGARAQLEHGGAAALGERDDAGLVVAEVEARRGVQLAHRDAGVERARDLPVTLDEERRAGTPPEASKGLEPRIRRAGDRGSSCHCSCSRRSGEARKRAAAPEGRA
jgi:hypothetical protein